MQQTTDPTTLGIKRPPQSVQDISKFYIERQASIYKSHPSHIIHTTDVHSYMSLIFAIDNIFDLSFHPYYTTPIDDVLPMYKISTYTHVQLIR